MHLHRQHYNHSTVNLFVKVTVTFNTAAYPVLSNTIINLSGISEEFCTLDLILLFTKRTECSSITYLPPPVCSLLFVFTAKKDHVARATDTDGLMVSEPTNLIHLQYNKDTPTRHDGSFIVHAGLLLFLRASSGSETT